MATKTISIDMEAYERLSRSRTSPDESFSKVIKRAHWDERPKTAGALLKALKTLPLPRAETLDALDKLQKKDRLPEDPWRHK